MSLNIYREGKSKFLDFQKNFDTKEDFVTHEIVYISEWIENNIDNIDMEEVIYKEIIINGFDIEECPCYKRLEESKFNWNNKKFFDTVREFEKDIKKENVENIIKKYNLNYSEKEIKYQNITSIFQNDFEDFDLELIHLIYNKYITEFTDILSYIYDRYVEKFISCKEYKVGDYIYLISKYPSRPYYGLSIIDYDYQKDKKILVQDGEGMPYLCHTSKKNLSKDYDIQDIRNFFIDKYGASNI